jgi:hypothetical protein
MVGVGMEMHAVEGVADGVESVFAESQERKGGNE